MTRPSRKLESNKNGKIWYQAVRLNEQWMCRLEVAATALS